MERLWFHPIWTQMEDSLILSTTAGGTYTSSLILGHSTGNLTLTLYDVPADVSGTITPGGSADTVTTTVPGQNNSVELQRRSQ